MNYDDLRRSLRQKWLEYYRENRPWLSKLAVWVDDRRGFRRPTSSYILATMSVLEPQLGQLFPLMVELSHDPDRVVEALGLNFSPEDALKAAERAAARQQAPRLGRALAASSAIAIDPGRATSYTPNEESLEPVALDDSASAPLSYRARPDLASDRWLREPDESCEGRGPTPKPGSTSQAIQRPKPSDRPGDRPVLRRPKPTP